VVFWLDCTNNIFVLNKIVNPHGGRTTYSYVGSIDLPPCGHQINNYAIARETESGPGMETSSWSYDYYLHDASTGKFCIAAYDTLWYGNTTTVTGKNKKIVYTFDTRLNTIFDMDAKTAFLTAAALQL